MPLFRELTGAVRGAEQDSATRQLVISEMEAACPLLLLAQFSSYQGDGETKLAGHSSATGLSKRAIDSDYTAEVTPPRAKLSTTLQIGGGKVVTDIARERRSKDLEGEHLTKMRSRGRAMGRDFTNEVVNGNTTVDPLSIKGLKALSEESDTAKPRIKRVVFNGALPMGTSDTVVAKQDAFFETFNKFVLNKDVILMPDNLAWRIETIARERVKEIDVLGVFGDKVRLLSYRGVPIIITGQVGDTEGEGDGAAIIPFNEEVSIDGDDYDTATSLYGLKLGEDADLAFYSNVGLVCRALGNNGIYLGTQIDFDYDMLPRRVAAGVRMSGILV